LKYKIKCKKGKFPHSSTVIFSSTFILTSRKTIGRGTFGKVKKAIHQLTQEPVAIKVLEK
jgi:serine/threonine protein kinase